MGMDLIRLTKSKSGLSTFTFVDSIGSIQEFVRAASCGREMNGIGVWSIRRVGDKLPFVDCTKTMPILEPQK